MVSVSATDVKNRFGEYMDEAQKGPVSVEKTGRPYVVMLSQQEYERLQRLEDVYWGERAKAAANNGFLGTDATMAKIRERLNAIERGEE